MIAGRRSGMTRSVAAGSGILLPTGLAQWGPGDSARRLLDLARCGEDAGADSLWTNDMLSALAPVTRHVRLGTAALLPAFRDPVQSARAVATVDHLTEGRLVVTVGAGRDPDALTPTQFLTVLVVPDPETGRAAIDAFCRDDYGHPFDVVRTVQAFAVGTGADVAQRVAEYRAAGARHLVLRIATADMDG